MVLQERSWVTWGQTFYSLAAREIKQPKNNLKNLIIILMFLFFCENGTDHAELIIPIETLNHVLITVLVEIALCFPSPLFSSKTDGQTDGQTHMAILRPCLPMTQKG